MLTMCWTHEMGFVLFGNKVSVNSPGWLGTRYGDQAGLQLTEICLLLSLGAEIKGVCRYAG